MISIKRNPTCYFTSFNIIGIVFFCSTSSNKIRILSNFWEEFSGVCIYGPLLLYACCKISLTCFHDTWTIANLSIGKFFTCHLSFLFISDEMCPPIYVKIENNNTNNNTYTLRLVVSWRKLCWTPFHVYHPCSYWWSHNPVFFDKRVCYGIFTRGSALESLLLIFYNGSTKPGTQTIYVSRDMSNQYVKWLPCSLDFNQKKIQDVIFQAQTRFFSTVHLQIKYESYWCLQSWFTLVKRMLSNLAYSFLWYLSAIQSTITLSISWG